MNQTIAQKKLYLFDLDGTVFLGETVFCEAIDFVSALRGQGKKILFFTNNASHHRDFYLQKLRAMGFEPQKEEILTAGDVTAAFLCAHRAGKTVYLLGTDQLKQTFVQQGICLCKDGAQADIVVSSFDTGLTYDRLNHACTLICNGAEYFCTHRDYRCPMPDGFAIDSGSIAAAISACTGVTPRFFGKPEADTMQMIETLFGVGAEEICVFGDRLYTDIAFGKQNGATSVLLLTGETKKEDLAHVKCDNYPDFVYHTLKDVSADHNGVVNFV